MTDWVSVYFKSKKNNLYQYTDLISKIISIDNKRILSNKKRATEIFEKVIDLYIDKYYFGKRKKINLNDVFIQSEYIDQYDLNDIISIIIEVFIASGIILDIKNNDKEIILIAVIVKMAIQLNQLTNPYLGSNQNFNSSALNFINKYHKIDFIYLIDQGKKNTRLLIEQVKENHFKEKEFFNLLTHDNSFNKYIRINENLPLYIVQYNYYISDLEKFDPRPIKDVYETSGVGDNFLLISIELVLITLLKEASSKKELNTYLIPVKESFFNKEKNIRMLRNLYHLDIIKGKIKVLINYDDLTTQLQGMLKRNKIDYYIYCNQNAEITKFDENEKYILSKAFIKKHQIEKLENTIFETINVFFKDDDILSLKKKESKK